MASAWMRRVHALVFALILPLAFSSALPAFARVVAGPTPHMCHCQMRGGHGAMSDCPICNPDRDDFPITDASLRGTCGDEDVVFGAALGFAVLAPAACVILAPRVTRDPRIEVPSRITAVFVTPPTPPPRSVFA